MKEVLKRGLFVVFAMVMLVMCMPSKAFAYSGNGTENKPVNLGTGGTIKKSWSGLYKDREYYVSFKMAKKGYATISVSKAYRNKELQPYKLYLYNSKGKEVWNGMTNGQAKTSSKSNVFYVGLNKGNYKLKIEPTYYYNWQYKSTISVKTTAKNYWEVEYNDTAKTANTLKLNKKYTGVYCDNTFKNTGDYYKVKLTQGKTYTIKFGNAKKLFANTTICKVYDSKMNEVRANGANSTYAGYTIKRNGSASITAPSTGYYYIMMYNDAGYTNPIVKYTITVK